MTNFSLQLALIAACCTALLFSPESKAQSANQLYICDNGSGSTNIVSAAQRSGKCKPYQKGMFGNYNAGATVMPLDKATESFTDKAESSNLFANVIAAEKQQAAASANPASVPLEDFKETGAIHIFYCPDYRNGRMIEATSPPEPTCRSIGIKAEVQDPRGIVPTPKTTAEPQIVSTKNGSGAIVATDSPPTDIYKCFDQEGLPTFVAGDQTDKYRRCSFFQRSYAGAKADFTQQARQPQAPSLTRLAAQGVGAAPTPTASAALRCVGAGKVEFNGSTREYNCATRSFDMTPGSSGGQVILGDRSANIAAHRLDYFGSEGSCSGVVTTPEGRVLHLDPTKDCPQALKIEARRIEAEYVKTISVNVSGAFLERQRGLSAQINEIAARIGVDPYLVHAVISAESAYKSRAVSHAGAQGLMQLMPATARRFGVSDSFHTGENIRGGTTYLKWLLKEFNGNYQLAIAGYNAGEGNVKKYGYKIPPFIETRAYVPKVMEYYRKYKANPALIGLQ